jgi:hypothetical protein
MDIGKLIEAEGTADERVHDFAVVKQIALRLDPLIGPFLSTDQAVALMGVLLSRTFECEDGFMINGFGDEVGNHELGHSAVGSIAYAFCQDRAVTVRMLVGEYHARAHNPPDLWRVEEDLVARITRGGTIRRLSDEEVWSAVGGAKRRRGPRPRHGADRPHASAG